MKLEIQKKSNLLFIILFIKLFKILIAVFKDEIMRRFNAVYTSCSMFFHDLFD